MARRTKKEEEEASNAQQQQVANNDVAPDQESLSQQFKDSLSFFAPQIIGGLIGGLVDGDEGAVVGMKTAGTFADSYRAHEQQQFENENARIRLRGTSNKPSKFQMGNAVDTRSGQQVAYDPDKNEYRNTNGELIPGQFVRNRVDIGAAKREGNKESRFLRTGSRKDIKESRLQRGQDESNRDDERNFALNKEKFAEGKRKSAVSEILNQGKFVEQRDQFDRGIIQKESNRKLRESALMHQKNMFSHAKGKDAQVQGEYAEKFSNKVAMIKSLDVASVLSKKNPITGQVIGRYKNFTELFKDEAAFTEARVNLGHIMVSFIKDTSGTAVSAEERVVLEQLMPRLKSHPAEFGTTLKTVNEIINRNATTSLNARIAARPLEKDNLEQMRSLLPSQKGKMSPLRLKKQARIKQLREEIEKAKRGN